MVIRYDRSLGDLNDLSIHIHLDVEFGREVAGEICDPNQVSCESDRIRSAPLRSAIASRLSSGASRD